MIPVAMGKSFAIFELYSEFAQILYPLAEASLRGELFAQHRLLLVRPANADSCYSSPSSSFALLTHLSLRAPPPPSSKAIQANS